ncbi:iron export ABC transporter permease subunit FetB [Pelistega sp. MC2]|uniref:ABC transporter permease n=1 Tax=Pelistega sp. MC2 TaxID=1720297 RepID=UPI0008DA5DBF|nr:iron export ABC transporter permease subunit FetB [Pelistega sp. MC2]
MNYHEIGLTEIFLAACLVFINGLISFVLNLGLGKSLLIASIRTIVQLSLIGIILKWIFSINEFWVVLLWVTLMMVIAAQAAKNRLSWSYSGIFHDTFISVFIPAWFVVIVGIELILNIQPWYSPQYLIPMAGMIIGNILTAISLVLNNLLSQLTSQRERVDSLLALGATPWEAFRGQAAQAVKTGMMPTINSMTVVGLVSLPGMMTGQVLAGQDPEQAIRYQIVIMFFLAVGTGLSCVLLVYTVFKRLFDANGTFLFNRLMMNAKKKK